MLLGIEDFSGETRRRLGISSSIQRCRISGISVLKSIVRRNGNQRLLQSDLGLTRKAIFTVSVFSAADMFGLKMLRRRNRRVTRPGEPGDRRGIECD